MSLVNRQTTSQEATISLDYAKLARAASDNDAHSDLGWSYEQVIDDLGTTAEDLRRAGEQRAMRLLMIRRGEHHRIRDAAFAGHYMQIDLSHEEEELMSALLAMWTDGAATALRAIQREQQ
jgi:hypothetical protein